jgi:SAM-dependent methyltransferase
MGNAYTHGHHDSVVRSHAKRTVENSANYLLPRLKPGLSLLDIGAGPGSITRDFAAYLSPGPVTGIDVSEDIVAKATSQAHSAQVRNLSFEHEDAYALSYADNTFDIVHAHQVLQHAEKPVAMLEEMRRVAVSGGTVAAREVDYGGVLLTPELPGLSEWLPLYLEVHRGINGEPCAGRWLKQWARTAGLHDLSCSASVWLIERDEDRASWGTMWAQRVLESDFARHALDLGLADSAKLKRISDGWLRWVDSADGWMLMPHAEILATA